MTTISARPATVSPPRGGVGEFVMTILADRERFYDEVAEGDGLPAKLRHAFLTLVVLCGLYGACAGAYAGPLQAAAAAIKLPALFLGTLAISFPGFFIVQVLLGSRLRFAQVLALVLGALALGAIVLAAVVPISAFFLLTGANYYFLTLLHVALVLGAGLVAMIALHAGLEHACEKRGVYPRKAVTIMRVWAVLFAFVGIQMAWNLQPFVGDRGRPFQLFRHNEGNFYAAVLYSLRQLTYADDRGPAARQAADEEARQKLEAASREQPFDSTRAPGR